MPERLLEDDVFIRRLRPQVELRAESRSPGLAGLEVVNHVVVDGAQAFLVGRVSVFDVIRGRHGEGAGALEVPFALEKEDEEVHRQHTCVWVGVVVLRKFECV